MNLKVQLVAFVVAVWLVGDVVAAAGGGKKNEPPKKEGLGKKKPGKLPQVVCKNVSTVDISSWAQMINNMKNNDWCADAKRSASVATSYCGRVTTLLDKLPPYMRKPECRHVTAGACRKISGLTECTLKTYDYRKLGRFTVGWKTNSGTLRFKDCVGKIEWDEAKHAQWLRTGNVSP